jgi:hypothetical protein
VRPKVIVVVAIARVFANWGEEAITLEPQRRLTFPRTTQWGRPLDVLRWCLVCLHKACLTESWDCVLSGGLVVVYGYDEGRLHESGPRPFAFEAVACCVPAEAVLRWCPTS